MSTKATDIVEICKVEGECTVSKTRVIEWYRLFNNGETSLEDQPRSGRPSTMNIEALHRELVEQQPQTSTHRLSSAELDPSKSSTIAHHLNEIGLVNRCCCREVPLELNVAQEQRRHLY